MNVTRRSSMGWRGRLAGSKSSFRIAPRPAESTAPTLLTAVPDRRRRLSEGILVEASVLARLLGIRLLKLDATVVLMPADDSPFGRMAVIRAPQGEVFGLIDPSRTVGEPAAGETT